MFDSYLAAGDFFGVNNVCLTQVTKYWLPFGLFCPRETTMNEEVLLFPLVTMCPLKNFKEKVHNGSDFPNLATYPSNHFVFMKHKYIQANGWGCLSYKFDYAMSKKKSPLDLRCTLLIMTLSDIQNMNGIRTSHFLDIGFPFLPRCITYDPPGPSKANDESRVRFFSKQ